ncbi:MAG TPA: ATP-binding protein, partial [Panacibacter sp.]|nr:ATP-binding protein [Panacibacter sp.]
SNAFKFTRENGSVSVDVENGDKRLRISVQDSGTGIPKEQLDKIFDRFYQVDGTEGGTGIGLSLVKELVQLHKGQISVSSDTGRGTRFRLSIPIAREFYTDDEIEIAGKEPKHETVLLPSENIFEEDTPAVTDASLPVVLIVEDNADLQIFISDILKHEFNIVIAGNGREGLQKAISIIPDLIVSDVMMPVMDGVSMTNEIKHNEKTSHIPVIMLTAKAATESKIEGLKIGADDYLIKPFDGIELIVRIQNLIDQRRKLRELFSQQVISIAPSKVAVQSQEHIFLDKVRTAIDENLDNELFGVVDLANAVNMSRSQLHRKLKALTGNGPNELIRNFRLERALELLQKNAGNITEVAFMTGFSSPAYFSKCFSERFGYAPNEVRKE